jgi:hypothetical protein
MPQVQTSIHFGQAERLMGMNTRIGVRFVSLCMHLEFHHPSYSTPIITSPIQEICERPD